MSHVGEKAYRRSLSNQKKHAKNVVCTTEKRSEMIKRM